MRKNHVHVWLVFFIAICVGTSYAQIARVVIPKVVDYSQRINLTLANNTPFDLEIGIGEFKYLSPEDLDQLQASILYAHSEHNVSIRRIGYPAQIYMTFRIAATEDNFRGFSIAKWEYIEDGKRSYTCHLAEGTAPYTIGCSGNDNISRPSIRLDMGYISPPKDVSPNNLPSP